MDQDTDNNPAAPLPEDSTMGAEEAGTPPAWKPALKEAAWAFLAAALLLIVTYTIFFRSFHPEFIPFIDRDARKLVVTGKDFIPVSGSAASKTEDRIIIEDFNGDEAVLLLPRAFQAEDYPFIKVNLSGFTRYSKFKIIWRRADDIAQTYALEFNRSGDEVTQIAMVYGGEDYRGKIADIALLFYDGPALGFENNNDVDIVIDSIEFLPFSAARVAEQIFEDWTNPPLWPGYSHNFVRGIHSHGLVFPNAVANFIVIAGMAILALTRLFRERFNLAPTLQQPIVTALCLCLYAWAFNDVLRWQWRIEQLIDTHERYAGIPLEERIKNNDIRCARFPQGCAENLLPYF